MYDENINKEIRGNYIFPPLNLLKRNNRNSVSTDELKEKAIKIQQTLCSFGVNATVTNITIGRRFIRYELQIAQGTRIRQILNRSNDIKLNLAATNIYIEAPIPGKAAVGIDVENESDFTVMLREMFETSEFMTFPSDLAFAVGMDIEGCPVVADIAKMPHLLIGGTTGSGKTTCIDSIIMSILYKALPTDVKMILIDTKAINLSTYNGIPHLMIPVVTNPREALSALNWAISEAINRHNKFADWNVRDLKGYNKRGQKKLPQILIVIDDFSDLMAIAAKETEDIIVRFVRVAREAGMHLVIATQRPSADVITGLIKCNIPSRIAFKVFSATDSRVILDDAGAEKLLGNGDMLFCSQGCQEAVRIQGTYASDSEILNAVDFIKNQIFTKDAH